MKFRKKPVVIEATIFMGGISYDEMCVEWGKDFKNNSDFHSPTGELRIKTLEGWVFASLGDYVIKGVEGEFYPCKPSIFEKSYEPA